MVLTYYTDYAFRVLLYAAAHRERRVTLREIGTAYGISTEHLRKVVHRLARHGYLETAKGRGGGLTLGRAPASIRLGEIVCLMEETLDPVNCRRGPCPLCGGCSLKAALNSARDAFLERLNDFTLADLLADRRTFQRLSQLAPAV